MKKLLLFVVTLNVLTSKVNSQTSLDNLKSRAASLASDTTKRVLFTPGAGTKQVGWISQISLTAQQKDKKGNLNLDYKNHSNTASFHFAASQALSEGSTEVTPFNLDGISNGTSISVGFSKLFWRPIMTIAQLRNFESVRKNYFSRMKQEDQPLRTFDQLYPFLSNEEKDQLALSNVRSHPLLFNLIYKTEKNNYAFTTDSTTLLVQNESKYSHKLTAELVYFIKTVGVIQQLLTFNASLSSNYSAGDKLNLVTPFGTTRNYLNRELTFGQPERKTDELLGLEYRLAVNNDKAQNTFALAGSITYSLQKKLLALQVPIYFIRGKDKDNKVSGLQGGLRLGYLTSTEQGKIANFKKGFSAEIVITEPFDIFK